MTLAPSDSSCSICFTPYLTILTEEEMALAMDSPAHPAEELGVTKLSHSWQCGHLFCRREWVLPLELSNLVDLTGTYSITKWITGGVGLIKGMCWRIDTFDHSHSMHHAPCADGH
jgi:hypothetical protein